VISSVVFCPQAPVLVPDIAQAAAAELDDLRAACRSAIRQAVPSGVRPVLIGSGPQAAAYPSNARGTLAGYGLRLEVTLGADEKGPVQLPPSLTVGAWLVRDALGADSGAIGYSVADGHAGLPQFDGADPVALIVLGDGSACRSEKAPGYLDERARAFDAEIAQALAGGYGYALCRDVLGGGIGDELLVGGLAAWEAVHPLIEACEWDAEMLYDAAPYGVGYFVALWNRVA
jgi:hypothetical protein